MKCRLALLLCLMPLTAVTAAEMVANGGLAKDTTGWTLPDGAAWSRSADQGPNGAPCLLFNGPAGVAGAVRVRCDYMTPSVTYKLQVVAQSDGPLSPVVRVLDLATNTELARLSVPAAGKWANYSVTFRPASADVGLELWGDVGHQQGRASLAGQVRIASVSVQPAVAEVEGPFPDLGPNLALKRPYTMSPAPNYSLCLDPDDKIQLTDGVYTQGHFWTRKSTVGWGNNPVFITIDLGADSPIKGVSYNTAAGIAGVRWPSRIYVLVSPDGKQWHDVGNLVRLNAVHHNLPDYGQYAIRRLWTDQLQTHGRYVCLYVEPADNSFVFVDEIEIYRGDDALLQQPYAGQAFADPAARMRQTLLSDLLRAQFERDLAAVRADLAATPADARAPLTAEADRLARDITDFEAPADMAGFRAVLPVNPLEAAIFQLQAAVWRAQGKPALRVWTKCRWDMLEPSEEPITAEPPAVTVATMNNEWRAGVVNLTNAGTDPLPVRLRLVGLPGGTNPAYARVYEALTVGTRRFVAVTAALPELRAAAGAYTVTVPPGMTRQVWLSFRPDRLPAKTHEGAIELEPVGGRPLSVPLHLKVYPLRFPEQTSLCLGGWDYTDADSMYGITPGNREAVIAHLKEHYVNAPWASSSVLQPVTFSADGSVKSGDTSRFDRWQRTWPDAKMYMVFLAVGESFDGEKMGTPRFDLKVGNWMRFWRRHLIELGVKPAQLGLLIYDEPGAKDKYDIIVPWAKAIKAAVPEFVTWEDPQPSEAQTPQEMFAAVDVLCPYRSPFLAMPDWYRRMFTEQRDRGKTLWMYNADGPARSFDPFSFYLLQQWHCFAIGAKGSCFWAFGDSGGVSCWNEYAARGNGPYCPSYLDATSVTTSKYMEAIREGVQDYEYLVMLQARVAELAQQGAAAGRLAKAKELLATGPARVLAGEQGNNYQWSETKDRTVQDRVRIEILEALAELTSAR